MMTCEGGDLHSISTFEVNFFFDVYKVHNDLVLIGLQLQPNTYSVYTIKILLIRLPFLFFRI